jgi:hypothetical protein
MGLSLAETLASLGRIFAMAVIMGVAVYLLDTQVMTAEAMPVRLVVGVAAGGALYLVLSLVSRDPTFAAGAEIMTRALRRRRA